jgi:hypothetical protein
MNLAIKILFIINLIHGAVDHDFGPHHGFEIQTITISTCSDCIYTSETNTLDCKSEQITDFYTFKKTCLNHNFERLIINGFNFSEYNESLFDIPMIDMVYLDLGSNRITFLSELLFQNLPKLNELILDDNQLVDMNPLALVNVSASLKVLSMKNAFSNPQGEISKIIIVKLKDLIEKSGLKLEKINLQSNNLTYFNYKKETYLKKMDFLCLNSHLKLLNLSSNLIEQIFFRTSCLNASLEILDLRNNRLNDENLNGTFLRNIIELKKNKILFTVNLDGNKFGCSNCAAKNLVSINEECYSPDSTIITFSKFNVNCSIGYDAYDNVTSYSLVRPTKSVAKPKSRNLTSRNLFIFLVSIIVFSTLLVYILNRNRKNIIRLQQQRYMMLRDNNIERISLNLNSAKKKSIFDRIFKFFRLRRNRFQYDPFNDDYVVGGSPIFKRDDSNEVVIMDRSSLNGSTSSFFREDKDELIKSPKLGRLVIVKTTT